VLKATVCYNGSYRIGTSACLFKGWREVKIFLSKIMLEKGVRKYYKITKEKYAK